MKNLEREKNIVKDSQPKVRIFTSVGCPYCFTLKEFFKEKGIEFEDIDISRDEEAQRDLIQKSGQMVVPVVEVDNQIVVGFDKEKIVKLLNIKE